MKTLIALSTCHQYERDVSNDAVRETWLSKPLPAGFDYKMFVGSGTGKIEADTIGLDCPDDYENLTWKLLAKLRWALEHGYDYVFSCFPDTYVVPERLASCGYENFDFMGHFLQVERKRPWATLRGGCGFFLSRAAMELVIKPPAPSCEKIESQFDDLWVTRRLLYWEGLPETRDPGAFSLRHYCPKKPPFEPTWKLFRESQDTGPRSWNRAATKHLYLSSWLPCLSYRHQILRDEHRSWLDSLQVQRDHSERRPLRRSDLRTVQMG